MLQFIQKVKAYVRILPLASRNRTDLLAWLWRRPQLLTAVGVYETALLSSSRAPTRIKSLAMLRVSSLIGCPF